MKKNNFNKAFWKQDLTVKAAAMSKFADLGGLTETYKKSIIVPGLKGIQ